MDTPWGPKESHTVFRVGIPNLVCGYTLGSPSVANCFEVMVTLKSDLGSRKIVARAYLLF